MKTVTNYDSEITLIKSHIPQWEHIPNTKIKFDRLSGLSNIVLKVSISDPKISPGTIIYRKFGQAEDIIDHHQEDYVFKSLAEKKIGPACYGGTEEYRLEQYFESQPLGSKEVNEQPIRRQLAKELAALHKIDLEQMKKVPKILEIIENEGMMLGAFEEKASQDIYTIQEQKWLNELLSLSRPEETEFLRTILPKNSKSIVLSHNDLHSQNILKVKKDGKLVFIDYEYCSYNYRGYDIANIFNETTISYEKKMYPFFAIHPNEFPSDKDLRDFVNYYLFFSKFKISEADEQKFFENEELIKQYIAQNHDLKKFESEICDLIDEVKVCVMLSHYYWCLWSVIMSKNPEIEFDYINYAHQRFDIYQNMKKEFLNSHPEIRKQLDNYLEAEEDEDDE